jgi:hypothetical protein
MLSIPGPQTQNSDVVKPDVAGRTGFILFGIQQPTAIYPAKNRIISWVTELKSVRKYCSV